MTRRKRSGLCRCLWAPGNEPQVGVDEKDSTDYVPSTRIVCVIYKDCV